MIEKGIPIPEKKSAVNKYNFAEFEVGDSMLIDGSGPRIRSAAAQYGARLKKEFTVRKVDGGFRVWRVS